MIRNTYFYSYIISLFFFKLAVGMILLATSWDALTLLKDPLLNISIWMAFSFLPATFARPLFNKLAFLPIERLLIVAFWVSSFLIMFEFYLILEKSYLAFAVNFILWVFVFIIEVSSEKWYVALSKGMKLFSVRKISGISTSIGQIGVILGPILVILTKQYSHSLVYWIISATLLLASITPSVMFVKRLKEKASIMQDIGDEHVKQDTKKLAYIFSFALIWPTLAIFNISVPILAKLQYHTIKVAGAMEVSIGIATALSGFLHPVFTKFLTHKKRISYIFFILTFFTILIYCYPWLLSIVLISTFFTGLTFGYLRIELRTFLSRRFSPKIAGEIVASANSWSGPLVLVYCVIFYFNASIGMQKSLNLIFPASFIMTALVFCFLLLSDTKYQEEDF